MEVDLQKLLLACLRKWWFILACIVVTTGITWYGTAHFITPRYEASVTVYVNNVSSGQQIDSITSSNLSTAQKLVSTYVNMIKSDTVLEKVAEAADVGMTAEEIRRAMSAAQVEETELFRVVITHEDPETAAHLANAVAQVAPVEIERFVVGSSARIIDYARVPGDPASPNLVQNCLLGAMVGCVLAVVYVVLQVLMDVRVKGAEDLNAMFDLPVLGQIPEFSSAGAVKSGYGYDTVPTGKGGTAK